MSERGVSQAKIDALLHQAGVAVQPTAQPSAEAAPPERGGRPKKK